MREMNDPAPAPPPGVWRPTLHHQCILVGVVAGIIVLCLSSSLILFPEATAQDRNTPGTILAGLATAFGQVGWISMDRRRRGHEVGPWRFFALFCGPLAIWTYLALEYRSRAVYLIPLSFLVYVATFGTGVLGTVILQALQE